ncbi:MAG: DUF3592 domain-containing protein [Kiritimatiellia bacterium]
MLFLICFLFWCALWSARETIGFISTADTAQGTVIGYETRQISLHDPIIYYPVVSFKARDGSKVQFTDAVGSHPRPFSKDQNVPLYYQPSNPSDARINHIPSLWFKPLLFAGLSVVPMFLIFCLWLQRFNKNNESFQQSGPGNPPQGVGSPDP